MLEFDRIGIVESFHLTRSENIRQNDCRCVFQLMVPESQRLVRGMFQRNSAQYGLYCLMHGKLEASIRQTVLVDYIGKCVSI